jgi:hypothetical protein
MADNGRPWAQAALYVALVVAILSAIALPAMAAEPRTLLTIADGPVQVLRGEQKFDASEGLGLADDDIVRTAPSVRVARIEFADGRVLDLGPETQVLLLSERTAKGQQWAGATAVVMQGWAKLAAGAAAGRLVMPRAEVVSEARGTVLVHSAADGAALAFAESRGMTVLPRGAGADVTLREGESWTRDATTTTARVSSRMALVVDVPRALADKLPRRAALFDGGALEPAEGVPLEAADLAPWRLAEPKLVAALHPPPKPRRQRTTRTVSAPARPSAVAKSPSEEVTRPPVSPVAKALLLPADASGEPGNSVASALPPETLLTSQAIASSARLPTPAMPAAAQPSARDKSSGQAVHYPYP